ncbi:DMT family transporter [Mitsuaria sp. GD03876]|uniref:DMT family transporter n=1 Tax=Mitsuaria sp. GD03876 TaxID=2975399 RepID=UPI002447F06F|nr:DMT family transporter [Mitsuaria sp. GD03876]MDH0864768.1 DMT family transporter [Mitsuaria sp. GD03876]
MSPSNPYAATAAMLFAAVSWGSLFLVGKPVLGRLDPIWFTAVRYLLAGIGMTALVVAFGQRPWAKLRAHWGTLTGFGVLGYGFFGILVLEGLKLSLPSHGAVLMATMPLTTILLRWLLDGHRPGLGVAGAAGLALGGVVMVSGVLGRADGPPHMLLGDALTLLGTLGWVLYTRGAAKLPDLSPLEFTGLTALAALPWQLGFALAATAIGWIEAPAWSDLTPVAPHLLYIAAVPTVAAVVAFNFGVRRLGASRGTLFLNGVPVSALLMSVALGQHPAMQEWIGAALVIAALTLSTRAPTASRPPVGACAAVSPGRA